MALATSSNDRKTKPISTRMGFEPTRAEHIGLAVQRLNHSATSSILAILEKKKDCMISVSRYETLLRNHMCDALLLIKEFPMPGIEPGPAG